MNQGAGKQNRETPQTIHSLSKLFDGGILMRMKGRGSETLLSSLKLLVMQGGRFVSCGNLFLLFPSYFLAFHPSPCH